MDRLAALLVVLSLATCPLQAMAASEKAQALRKQNGLVLFAPSETFLQGGFIASEMEPALVYGPVADFAAGREFPTVWLIEQEEKDRVEKSAPSSPVEYSLYLEEDRPDQTIYYVFLDQSAFTPQQWLEWRRKFHKRKADAEYGAVTAKLEKALQDGAPVRAELRFVVRDGEVVPIEPEKQADLRLKMKPLYDLNQGERLTR